MKIVSSKNLPLDDGSARIKFFSSQVISTIIISSTMTHAGVTLAFPNLLRSEFESDIVATYASISALATPIGTFLTIMISDRLGRKKTMILLKLLSIFSWLVATLLRNPVFFYFSSVLSGLTRGALTASCPAYVAEISQGDYRQLFLSLLTLFFTVGIFFVTMINKLLQWQEAAFCFIVFLALLLALIVFFVPESPHWLAIIKLDMRRAKVVLRKLNPDEKVRFIRRGTGLLNFINIIIILSLSLYKQTFNKEWNLMMKKHENLQTSSTFIDKLSMIRQPKVYKPFIILLLLIIFQQICCIYPMTSFTVFIIPIIGKNIGAKYTSEIFLFVGILRLLLCLLTTLFLTKFNQKQLLVISSVGMLVTALPISSLKYFLNETAHQTPSVDWMMIVLLLLYICASCIGVLGVPWTIISELLPTEVRGLLGPFLVTVGYVTMSGTMKIFPVVLKLVSMASLFLFLTVISLLGLIFICIYIPETRGKSLVEIEKFFTKKESKIGKPINP